MVNMRIFCSFLVCTAFMLSYPAFAQDAETFRKLCTNEAARKEFEQQIADYDREYFAYEIADRCPRLDLPDTPVHEAADTSRENSHVDWVYDARYSPDGKLVVSASLDGSVRIWDTATGRSLRKITIAAPEAAKAGDKIYVRHAAFLDAGKTVAATSDSKPVEFFDAVAGTKASEFAFLPAKQDRAFAPHIASANGLLFVAGANDELVAYDPLAKEVKFKVDGHTPEAGGVAASDAAKVGASSASLGLVYLWRLDAGKEVKSVQLPPEQRAGKLAFSRDGKKLAVLAGGIVYIYTVPELQLARTILVHPRFSVFDAAFTADGKGLLVCRSHLVLWDLETGKIVRHYGPFNDLCHSVDVSPDGTKAITTSMASDIKLWDIATGTFERRFGIDVRPPR